MLHKTPIRPGPAGRFGELAQQHQHQADFPSGIQTAENGQPCKGDSTPAVGESAQPRFVRRLKYIARFLYWMAWHRSTKHVRWVLAFEGLSW